MAGFLEMRYIFPALISTTYKMSDLEIISTVYIHMKYLLRYVSTSGMQV